MMLSIARMQALSDHAFYIAGCPIMPCILLADAQELSSYGHILVLFLSLRCYSCCSHAWMQMLSKPLAQREGALPVLRSGAKWPCATLHRTPMLAPFAATFTGPTALKEMQVGDA
eukprot:407670-Pelagomonas_calceolata.AAC.1